jgi:hypothetical protein
MDFNFNFGHNSIREGGESTFGGHQIGHISTIISCNSIDFQQELNLTPNSTC